MNSDSNDPSKRIVRIAIFVIAAAVALVLLWPRAKERLAPRPTRALVAVQPAGAGAAVTGPVEVEPGEPFTLHAVLEAEARGGERIYYTEAPALEVDGRAVATESLRTWDRALVPRIFWFTVEGPAPYLELETAEQLERFSFTEFFHPEWPATWSIDGRLDSGFSQSLAREQALGEERSFGTQRYQVRIELFADEDALTPVERFHSANGSALPEEVGAFPTVYAGLPGAAGPASLAFGLTQIAPPEDAPAEVRRRLARMTERRLAFSRPALVRDVLAAAGTDHEAVEWTEVDLESGPAWEGKGPGAEAVGRGDLLRVGQRVVVLFDDRGVAGRLDRSDLAFDYEQGAAVRALSDVFTGEGLVELARLERHPRERGER